VPEERRPLLAATLTLVGGGLIAVAGLFLSAHGMGVVGVPDLSRPWYLAGGGVGLLTMAVGGSMGVRPGRRRLLGAVALACAGASVPLAFGGFVAGYLLTATGGALAVARPTPRATPPAAPSSTGPAPPWT